MIIEIALGIVLAVIILRFLPLILGLGLVAILAGLALLILGVAIWGFWAYPEQAAMLVGIPAIGFALLWAGIEAQTYFNKRFGAESVNAFSSALFSALIPCAVALTLGGMVLADLVTHGLRRDGDLEAPLYWVLYAFFLLALIAAIYYARVFWRMLRRSWRPAGP